MAIFENMVNHELLLQIMKLLYDNKNQKQMTSFAEIIKEKDVSENDLLVTLTSMHNDKLALIFNDYRELTKPENQRRNNLEFKAQIRPEGIKWYEDNVIAKEKIEETIQEAKKGNRNNKIGWIVGIIGIITMIIIYLASPTKEKENTMPKKDSCNKEIPSTKKDTSAKK